MAVLDGVRVVEVAGIGPGPFCGMVLADLGAEVLRVDRPGPPAFAVQDPATDVLARGRRSVALDLKRPEGVETLLQLADRADVLFEGFRPGVADRLGFGPEVCRQRNQALVYGRMSGWGQDGPAAARAGHDLTYLALAGVVEHIPGPDGRPGFPINLLGDFGGGGMLLALGIVAALLERTRSGQGQVVDAAIVDGAALLMAMIHGLRAAGAWPAGRGGNLLDGGAHFYGTYECADGRYLAVGALEPQFYAELLAGLGLSEDPEFVGGQYDRSRWPRCRERLAAVFRMRPRDEWCALFEHTDACVAPVLSMEEAPGHPHLRARGTFTQAFGVVQPAPAPRFSRSGTTSEPTPPPRSGQHSAQALRDWGIEGSEVDALIADGVVVQA